MKKKGLLPEIKKFIASSWILLILAAEALSAIYGTIHLYGNYYKLGVIDAVGAIAGSLLVFGLCNVISSKETWLRKSLEGIGTNSLLIYCLHFLEHNVMPVDRTLMFVGMTDKTMIALLSWMIISGICCLIATVLKKVPFVRKIYGLLING